MAPKLYYTLASSPSRAVLLCAKELGIDLDLQDMNLVQEEQLKPDYLKLNPQHTVPTLVDDDGFVINDSHAIMPYLIGKFSKDINSLYPTDIKKRAIVDQRLHFDSGILFARGLIIGKSILSGGAKEIAKPHADALREAYDFVETFLANSKYIAGDQLTIADFSILTTITTWEIFVPLDSATYPKITAWIRRLGSLPNYDSINKAGVELFKNKVRALLPAE